MDSNPRPRGLANLFATPPNAPAGNQPTAGGGGEDILSELDNVAFTLNQTPPSTSQTNPNPPAQAPVFPGLHSMAHNSHQPQQQQPQQPPSNFAALQQQILMMRTLNASKSANNSHPLNNHINMQSHSQAHANAAAHARAMAATRMSPVQKRARAPLSQQQKNHQTQMFLAQQQHLARAGHGAQHAQQQHNQHSHHSAHDAEQQRLQQQQQMALRWSQHQQRMHAMNNPSNMAQLQAQQQQQYQQSRLNGSGLSRLPAMSSVPKAMNPRERAPQPVAAVPVPADKYASELARKVCELEIEAARKRQRLEGAPSKHHLHALAPDTSLQFADCFDAWQRLLPFHTMLPPDKTSPDTPGDGDGGEKSVREVARAFKKWSEKLAMGIMDATAPKDNSRDSADVDNTEALRVAAMGYYDELKEYNKVQAELKEAQRKEAERRHEEMLIRAAEAAKQQREREQQHQLLQQQHFAPNKGIEGMVAASNSQQPLGMAEINAMPLPGIHDQHTHAHALPQAEWPFEGGGRTSRP